MDLTETELATVTNVYGSVALSLGIPLLLIAFGRLPRWAIVSGLVGFTLCAFGWEIWFTYGLVDGLDVSARRSAALNAAIPQNINWLMNSTADMGICFIGILAARLAAGGYTAKAFGAWYWPAFLAMGTWFVAQNLYVELVVYQAQLAKGFDLSWAPLVPTGPYLNPHLEIAGRSLTLQGQISWLIMSPLYYWLTCKIYQKFAKPTA